MTNSPLEGTVVQNRGAHFEVLVEGRVIRCFLRGRLKKDKRRMAVPVAAGDRVRVAMLEPGQGVIEEVLPRRTDLSRMSVGNAPRQHTLVANLHQAVIVFAAAEPQPDLFLLDRLMVQAIAGGLELLLCINKADLVDSEPLRARFAVYRQEGFPILFTSAERGDDIDRLKFLLTDKRSVLCGPSGVGKSSLLNAIAPNLDLRVSHTGEVTHKGRHTTTAITLMELPFGGWVADTAGLRQLGFWEVTPSHVASVFPDIIRIASHCRYADCQHRQEPGCAVSNAVAGSAIQTRRLKSYQQIMQSV